MVRPFSGLMSNIGVTSRGDHRENIFEDDDRVRFLEILGTVVTDVSSMVFIPRRRIDGMDSAAIFFKGDTKQPWRILDIEKEPAESAEEQFDSNFFLMTAQLKQLLPDWVARWLSSVVIRSGKLYPANGSSLFYSNVAARN